MLLTLLITICTAAAPECHAEHSEFYLRNQPVVSGAYWLTSTAIGLFEDPCEQITAEQFDRAMAQHMIPPAYSAAYIIDRNNAPYPQCARNIRGNLVIAITEWNRGMVDMCWRDVAAEKQAVYGDLFTRAAHHVVMCCKYRPLDTGTLIVMTLLILFSLGTIFYLRSLFLPPRKVESARHQVQHDRCRVYRAGG